MNSANPALDETLRKIGRNVLLFQRMEMMLKYLIPRANLGGTVSSLRANLENAQAAVSKQTLGNLVGPFFDAVYGDHRKNEDTGVALTEAEISFTFRIEADEAERVRHQAALKRVVEQRNHLIHHMLAKLDQHSPESCKSLSAELDAQSEDLRPEFERLRSLAQAYISAAKQGIEEVFGKAVIESGKGTE